MESDWRAGSADSTELIVESRQQCTALVVSIVLKINNAVSSALNADNPWPV